MRVAKSSPNQKGQSLIEVAISLPVILLILLGAFDIGMALFSYSVLRESAQEGALYGSFNPRNKAEIENRARNIQPRKPGEVFSSPVDLLSKENVRVDVSAIGAACQGVTNGAANSIQVKVTFKYPILFPFIGRFLGSNRVEISSVSSSIILQPPCQ
ncbi:MAG: pilus assembly protein [Anaerolineales bacterium]|nr:pilus assembly protein [Anaerolineales bacterium]